MRRSTRILPYFGAKGKLGTGQGTNAPEILLLNGRSFTDDALLFSDTISP